MNNPTTDSLIAYMDKELLPNEQLQVEAAITANQHLQEELKNLQRTKALTSSYALVQKVQGIHTEMLQEQKQKKPTTKNGKVVRLVKRSIAVAASLAFVFTLYSYFALTANNLYSVNFQPYSIATNRGEKTSTGIKELYQQEKYDAVIQAYSTTVTPSIEELFLAGQAYCKKENIKNAITCFTAVIQQNTTKNTSILKEDAEYYLAMSYLKENNIEKALPLFTAIHTKVQHLYHSQVSIWFMKKLQVLKWKS